MSDESVSTTSVPPVASSDWAYFLDVDGTLIELAASPDAVTVNDSLLGLIARLHGACRGAVAIVSGRSLRDLQRLIGAVALPMAGLHGVQRVGIEGRVSLHGSPATAIQEARRVLAAEIREHPGLVLEDKEFTLALHYRQAPQLALKAQELMSCVLREYLPTFELQPGKFVFELKPAGVDKGSAILHFLEEAPFRNRRPVFIGDDASDEKGFEAVNKFDGVTIKVGKGQTSARYRLDSVAKVRNWLTSAVEYPT
ncbi:MAG: trehalose-phosphatase [Burkholderiales bacterium]|jgi:trehalose 6-phosphate phosphatase|nr:trehalose-phosphatase [Betaproteobacteria bacterium]